MHFKVIMIYLFASGLEDLRLSRSLNGYSRSSWASWCHR